MPCIPLLLLLPSSSPTPTPCQAVVFHSRSFLPARNSEPKSTWSPASVNNTSLAHELWKVPLPPKSITAPSRPPPGLTGQKMPLSTWDNSVRFGGGWSHSDARYTPGKSLGPTPELHPCLARLMAGHVCTQRVLSPLGQGHGWDRKEVAVRPLPGASSSICPWLPVAELLTCMEMLAKTPKLDTFLVGEGGGLCSLVKSTQWVCKLSSGQSQGHGSNL